MRTLSKSRPSRPAASKPGTLLVLALAATIMMTACGGSSSSSSGSQLPLSLSGNWQFTMAGQSNSDPD